nr:MAG TPA: hypothetical protein [Caudoviricetes sp.]
MRAVFGGLCLCKKPVIERRDQLWIGDSRR